MLALGPESKDSNWNGEIYWP